MKQYAVVVPVLYQQAFRWYPRIAKLAAYFTSKKQPFLLAVNGCNEDEVEVLADRLFDSFDSRFHIVYGGEEGNPYKARNIALEYAFQVVKASAVLLTDADCLPKEGALIHEAMDEMTPETGVVSGLVSTEVPTGTRHFDNLQGFECYLGHTLPGSAIGASMAFGRLTWDRLGPMKDDCVSGGDAEYAVRFRKILGQDVTNDARLHMVKRIDTFTLAGVIEKNLRRGRMLDPAFLSSEADLLESVAAHLQRHTSLFSVYRLSGKDPKHYKALIDSLFPLMFAYGQLTQHMDAPHEQPSVLHPSNHHGAVEPVQPGGDT